MGQLPGALPTEDALLDVFEVGQLVGFRRDGGETLGEVESIGVTTIRVRALNGTWAGGTETYRWTQWAPIVGATVPEAEQAIREATP